MRVVCACLFDNMCTVYLLWNVIYTVSVQEKLYDSTWYASRHLFQDVASQIELHEARQVLKCVPSQITVTQLKEKSADTHVCSRNAYRWWTLLTPRQTV